MSGAVCPYCRGPLDGSAGEEMVCAGCGTPHHQDCYQENGGCTVFGCSAGPAEEPKLNLSAAEVSGVTSGASHPTANASPGVLLASPPPVTAKAPPPPLYAAAAAPVAPAPVYRPPYGSFLFAAEPVPAPTVTAAPALNDFDFTPDPNAKNRTTFILLGALLGAVGAHNFYAGYRKKAIAQLCISVVSLGFASPMAWVWAVIDVFTIDRDGAGVKFKS
jgi:hypothetical protein